MGPISVAHYGQLPTVMLSFNLAPGVSVGDAVAAVQELADEVAAARRFGPTFTGSAKAFQEAFRTLPMLLLVTIILIYMMLAILYEHYGHPITILTALPFAGFGALATLLLFNEELNIFSFVGIILLIGLVKKNGIMMVDFALQMQREQRHAARGGDRRGVSGAIPADHDDDGGGDFRDAADRAGLRRGRGNAQAARYRGGGRAGFFAVPHAVRDAGLLRSDGARWRNISGGDRRGWTRPAR